MNEQMKVAFDALCALLSSGPRNSTVQQIVEYLRDGDVTSARRLYEVDGDKVATTQYQPKVQAILGCRLHGRHRCQSWLCRTNAPTPNESTECA